jgi:tRNA pseudouridine38-40 synthase
MRNLKLEIEYDGTNYAGWQVQAPQRKKSIQEVLEKTLRKILQEKIRLIVSGRTDAGTHALAQTANFKTNSGISADKLRKGLNALLPDDISISKVEEVASNFHSRFDAKSKIYRYCLLNRPHPSAVLRNTVYFYPYPLDIKLMQKESRALVGRHDFRSFQAADKKERGSIRTIKELKISRKGDFINIDIEADGFLYNMVRNIVGTLVEIGRGRFKKGSLRRILLAKDRKIAGPTLPARGLCLLKVKYT